VELGGAAAEGLAGVEALAALADAGAGSAAATFAAWCFNGQACALKAAARTADPITANDLDFIVWRPSKYSFGARALTLSIG
jgi:hypothetical protein